MSENCSHDCSSCSVKDCGERSPQSFLEQPNKLSSIKKVIGVVSGKGGVGKSSICSLSAVAAQRMDFRAAIMDADVTGPSIPRMFGIDRQVGATEDGILPAVSKTGIQMISTNLILEKPEDPVIWRGPVISGLVKQFWTDVIWDNVDFLFIDMPPGTGDVPLTVFQSIPVDGIVVVTSPQELVSMIVEKAVRMAEMMDVPVLGVIENMSYVKCPDCGREIKVFGDSRIDEIAAERGIEVIAKAPMDPSLSTSCDKGMIELYDGEWMRPLEDKLLALAREEGIA
ncbi:MAG: P-loop NTPase [Anaerovoracaceae bacterium]